MRGEVPCRDKKNPITLKVPLQSFGLDHKATGLSSLGRKCSRHHAGLLTLYVAFLTADLYIGGLFVLYIFLGDMFITNVKVPFIGQKCK